MGETNTDHLTASQKKSAYFAQDDGYDKNVYENDTENWFKIVGMLLLFYVFQGLHWWANFELAIGAPDTSTAYNIAVFIFAILIITSVIIFGAVVNRKKLTHEFYCEKISEERQRQNEAEAQEKQRIENEAKLAQNQ